VTRDDNTNTNDDDDDDDDDDTKEGLFCDDKDTNKLIRQRFRT
jgi:hypothetical protein